MGCGGSKAQPPGERSSSRMSMSLPEISLGAISMVKQKVSLAFTTAPFHSDVSAQKQDVPLARAFVRKTTRLSVDPLKGPGGQGVAPAMHELEAKYDLGLGVLLGRGANGSVIAVKNRSTQETFAMKVITLEYYDELAELRDEILLQSSLDHPNIAKIYEWFEDIETFELSIIMEHMKGGSLEAQFDAQREFSELEVAYLLKKLLSATSYCHTHGVVHRDIKLANLMSESTAEDAEIKLIDFGFAARLAGGQDIMTDQMGTPAYMAPELWGEDSNLFSGDIKRYDSSVDMWAIGVVAYALLCGEYPFVGLSMRDLKKAIHECAPHFGRGRWKEISDEAKHFCKGLLQRDPKLRMSATQAREHPFIQKVSEKRASETASHMLGRKTEIVNSFQTFSKADPLQKLAFELIAFTTPPTKLDELRELFQKIDRDGSGTLSLEEFAEAMSMHPSVDQDSITEMFFEMDVTRSGEVDYSEFLSATLAAQDLEDGDIQRAFSMLDVDEDGFITKDDIITALQGQIAEDAIVRALYAHSDDNGRVDLSRFEGMLRAGLHIGTNSVPSDEGRRPSLSDVRNSLCRQTLSEASMASLAEKSIAQMVDATLSEKSISKIHRNSVIKATVRHAEAVALTSDLKSLHTRQNMGTVLLQMASISPSSACNSTTAFASMKVSAKSSVSSKSLKRVGFRDLDC